MTPKEKAEDLLAKMNVIHYLKLGGKNKDCKGLPVSMHNDQIKQCALVAVDAILEGLTTIPYGIQYLSARDYYQEVKEEIEKI